MRMTMMGEPETLEALAAIEHERWSGCMRYLFTRGKPHADGSFTIECESVGRWQRQMSTPYLGLTESEKEADRAEVRKTLAALPFSVESARAWQKKAAYENGRATRATEKALEAEEALRYSRDAIDSAVASENAAVARVAQLEAALRELVHACAVAEWITDEIKGEWVRANAALSSASPPAPEQPNLFNAPLTADDLCPPSKLFAPDPRDERIRRLEKALNGMLDEHTDCASCDVCQPAYDALAAPEGKP